MPQNSRRVLGKKGPHAGLTWKPPGRIFAAWLQKPSGGSVKKAKTYRRVSFGGGVEKWEGPGRKGGGGEGKPPP